MKNSIWLLFLGVILILLLPFQSQAQEAIQEAAKTGLFTKIGEWFKNQATGIGFGLLMTYLGSKGYLAVIKKIANKGATITKEVGELFADSSIFLAKLDTAIKDDGTIQQNSVQELIAAGKDVIAEGKDVIISIKPK